MNNVPLISDLAHALQPLEQYGIAAEVMTLILGLIAAGALALFLRFTFRAPTEDEIEQARIRNEQAKKELAAHLARINGGGVEGDVTGPADQAQQGPQIPVFTGAGHREEF